MEQGNKIQRSEVWEQIYKIVSKIPRKEVDGDAADAPSVTTELEGLFLKLLPIQHVRQQSEQLVSLLRQYQKACEIMHVNKIDAKNFVEQYKTN